MQSSLLIVGSQAFHFDDHLHRSQLWCEFDRIRDKVVDDLDVSQAVPVKLPQEHGIFILLQHWAIQVHLSFISVPFECFERISDQVHQIEVVFVQVECATLDLRKIHQIF